MCIQLQAAFFGGFLHLLVGEDCHFYATVGLLAFGSRVVGNGLRRAVAFGGNAAGSYTFGNGLVGHGLGATLRQGLVDGIRAVGVGVFLQYGGHLVDFSNRSGAQVGFVGVKEDARVEGNFDAFAYALHFGVGHVTLQLFGLLVHLAANDSAGRATGSSTDDGANGRTAGIAANYAAEHAAYHSAATGTDNAALGGFAHAVFADAGAVAIRQRCRAGGCARVLVRSSTGAEKHYKGHQQGKEGFGDVHGEWVLRKDVSSRIREKPAPVTEAGFSRSVPKAKNWLFGAANGFFANYAGRPEPPALPLRWGAACPAGRPGAASARGGPR